MKKLGTIFSILLFIYACGKDDSPAVDNSPAATENVAPQIDATTFPAAETITDKDVIGTISATDPDGDDEKLVFSITANSNSLFNISDAGVLSLSEGKTLDASTPTHEITVSVTDGIDASNAKITIQVVDVTLSLDVEEIVLAKEDSAQAVATLMGITGTISWSSDNEDVASVDEEGNITALGSGNAIITASFENLSVTLTVTVNPDIYIVGSAQLNGDNGLRVVLWKNGEPTFLTDGTAFASGRDVFVSNGDVYAVGTERNNDNITVAKLWINGEPTDLSDGTISSYANSIFIENGNIYIAGDSFNNSWIPWVWFNGQFTNLSNGQTSNFAESIYVENGVTYVAGLENPGNNIEIAKQWVDFN
ncbi:MAG: Ig-like domain-containing protein, partial [Bacteroidota bacterium]